MIIWGGGEGYLFSLTAFTSQRTVDLPGCLFLSVKGDWATGSCLTHEVI